MSPTMTHLSKQEFALTAIFFFKEAWPQYIIAKTQDTKVPVYAWIFFYNKSSVRCWGYSSQFDLQVDDVITDF